MEKKTKIILVVFVVVILVISGALFFVVFQEKKNDPLSNLGYVNRELGFGLNPPQNWDVKEENTLIWFETDFSYSEENSSDSITLQILAPLPDGNYPTFSYLIYDKLNAYSKLNDENTSMSHSERTINGMNAHEFIWIISNKTEMKAKEIFVEKNGRVFYIYFGKVPYLYDKYLSIAEQSINSLTIV